MPLYAPVSPYIGMLGQSALRWLDFEFMYLNCVNHPRVLCQPTPKTVYQPILKQNLAERLVILAECHSSLYPIKQNIYQFKLIIFIILVLSMRQTVLKQRRIIEHQNLIFLAQNGYSNYLPNYWCDRHVMSQKVPFVWQTKSKDNLKIFSTHISWDILGVSTRTCVNQPWYPLLQNCSESQSLKLWSMCPGLQTPFQKS